MNLPEEISGLIGAARDHHLYVEKLGKHVPASLVEDMKDRIKDAHNKLEATMDLAEVELLASITEIVNQFHDRLFDLEEN